MNKELRIWKFIIPAGPHNARAIPGTEITPLGQPCPPIKADGCLAVVIARSAEEAMRMVLQDAEQAGRLRLARWVEVADVTFTAITPGVIALSY